MFGFVRRLETVPGERMSAKIRCSSSRTHTVPLGERFGVPSGQTVATNPNLCRSTSSFISSDNLVISTSHHLSGQYNDVPDLRRAKLGSVQSQSRIVIVFKINDFS